MELGIPSIDTSITDLSISRRRIWVRSATKRNRYGHRVITDTGWDLVQYDGFPEGYEPGADNFEQRGDSLKSDRQYTGIHWMDETDPEANILLRSGGRGTFSSGS